MTAEAVTHDLCLDQAPGSGSSSGLIHLLSGVGREPIWQLPA